MAQRIRVLTAPAEDLSLVPTSGISQLPGSPVLGVSRLLASSGTSYGANKLTHVHTNTYK